MDFYGETLHKFFRSALSAGEFNTQCGISALWLNLTCGNTTFPQVTKGSPAETQFGA
jgi:hypothetical protein